MEDGGWKMAYKTLVIGAVVVWFLCSLSSVAHAASVGALYTENNNPPAPQRQKRLEDGARKEGSLKYYSISATDLISGYIKGFTSRYPFIKAEIWRGTGNKLFVRTMMEHRSGRLDADMITVGTENILALKRSGILARYRSPEAVNFPKEQIDKDGYFHSDSLGIASIAYNHRLVKKEEAPKTYHDLLDPKWKDSVSIDMEPERA